MRRVQIKMRRENRQAFRIRRLDRQQRPALHLPRQQIDQIRQPFRRQMLHHLRTIHAAERHIRQAFQISKTTPPAPPSAPSTGRRDRIPRSDRCRARRMPRLARDFQKFPAPAAQVENALRSREFRHVHLLMLADLFFGPAEIIGETQPVEIDRLSRGVSFGRQNFIQRALTPRPSAGSASARR